MGGKILKTIGYIDDKIIEKFNLEEHQNKPITQSLDFYIHISKHANDFKDVDSFNNAIFNIAEIINNPYFVYYDKNKNSLHYYKFVDEYVCLIVKLVNKRNLYVSTIYPVNKKKINKLKIQQKKTILRKNIS